MFIHKSSILLPLVMRAIKYRGIRMSSDYAVDKSDVIDSVNHS